MPGATDIFAAIMGVLIPTAVGYTVLRLIMGARRMGKITSAALSYGLGMGILAQLMLILGMLGVPYTFYNIGVPLVGIFFLVLILRKRYVVDKPAVPEKPLSPGIHAFFREEPIPHVFLYAVTALFITAAAVYLFWRALSLPISSYDAINVIAFKAKIFFYEGSLSPLARTHHASYPIQVPLSETWIALNVGDWDDRVIKILFPLAYLSLLVVHGRFVRRFTSRVWTAISTLMLASSGVLLFHGTISYRDLFMAYFNTCVVLMLVYWYYDDDPKSLLLAGIFAGFASFTKLEGTLYVLVYTVLTGYIFLVKNKTDRPVRRVTMLRFVGPSYAMCALFHVYRIAAGIPQEKVSLSVAENIAGRILPVTRALLDHMFLVGSWNVVWAVFAISVVFNLRVIRDDGGIRILVTSIGMFLVFYFLNGVFTENFVWIGGSGSMTTVSRLLMQFFPLVTAATALINYGNAASTDPVPVP